MQLVFPDGSSYRFFRFVPPVQNPPIYLYFTPSRISMAYSDPYGPQNLHSSPWRAGRSM
jgi:hypothetical protein